MRKVTVFDNIDPDDEHVDPLLARLARAAHDDLAPNMPTAKHKAESSFTVFKAADGRWRWIAASSNAYRDRDREIVSTKALEADVARADSDQQYGPLRWWHCPGVDLGDCDFNAMHGRFLIESGTFRNERIALAVKSHAADLQLSIGFLHPPTQPDSAGVFHQIRRFERSLVPRGRASNPLTSLIVTKEITMAFDDVKRAALKALGLGDRDIDAISQQATAAQKEADAALVSFKSDTAPTDPVDVLAEMVALKADLEAQIAALKAPPVIDDPEDLADNGADEATEDFSGPTLTDDDLAAVGEVLGAVFKAALTEALAPLHTSMDMANKMQAHVGEMKTMLGAYTKQKDDAEAQRAQEVETLKQALKASQDIATQQQALLSARLAELETDQPRAYAPQGYQASTASDTLLAGHPRQAALGEALKGMNGSNPAEDFMRFVGGGH